MSRALDYLQNARPQAMSAYFAFLKDAGSRLDPKTRALISVITKVAVQTDKGLLQYVRKARAIGVTPDEILDALMMAFPALGLSKIVWAIDVLLENEVDGFVEATPVDADSELLDVVELAHVPEERAAKFYASNRSLLLHRRGAEVRAFKAYCSHQNMELMESGLQGNSVTCSQHGWRFDLPSGRCARGERWALTELPVTVVDGRVFVRWSK